MVEEASHRRRSAYVEHCEDRSMSFIGTTVSRRVALRAIGFLAATASLATKLAAQVRKQVTPEALATATVLLDQEFTEERLDVISPALQRNFDQFQMVRDLEIDDLIEPATILVAKWR